jgi:hypothetical protein
MTTCFSHGLDYNRATAYEVAVEINGATVVAGFTQRKTKSSLLRVAMDNAKIREMMLAAIPADDASSPAYSRTNGWQLSSANRIFFTGGTAKNPILFA